MNEKSASNVNERHAEQSDLLNFDEQIAHFAAGYANSQAVVRFLDTKAAAVIGIVPVVLGVVAAVSNWLQDFLQWKILIGLLGQCGATVFVFMSLGASVTVLVLACLCIAGAFKAISPRATEDAAHSVLFPFNTERHKKAPKPKGSNDFKSHVILFAGRPARSDAIEDYQNQIVRMSDIVADKFHYLNRALGHLMHLFVVSFLAILLSLALATACALRVQFPSGEQKSSQTNTHNESIVPEGEVTSESEQ